MDQGFVEWAFLEQIVGNFTDLYQYYFSYSSYLAAPFRTAATSIVYSLGLAFAALCFLKAPVDRLLSGLGVLASMFIAGFLLNSTTNTKYLGDSSGTELTYGAYYSFLLTGTVTDYFGSIVRSAWKASLSEQGGSKRGPLKDALAIAYANKSTAYADKFLQGEGKEAVKDYMRYCGKEAIDAAKTPEDLAIIRTVGVRANTLGMSSSQASSIHQDIINKRVRGRDDYGVTRESIQFERRQKEAISFLKDKLPVSNSQITGSIGYRIPTASYFESLIDPEGGLDNSSTPSFLKLSESESNFNGMTPRGSVSPTITSDVDSYFFPKNCYELYLVANETMKNLRRGVQGTDLAQELSNSNNYESITTANLFMKGITDQLNQDFASAGITETKDFGFFEQAANSIKGGLESISNTIDKFMLRYKIPILIASMAMLVAVLLITFPIFAVAGVFVGPKIFATYFKLMALPFLVVLLNHLFLVLGANLIAYNKMYQSMAEGLNPGAVDIASAFASMSSEIVLYSVLTACELLVAKLLLWDDVRSATNFNPAALATGPAARGFAIVSTAAALVGGGFMRAGSIAKAAKAEKAAQAKQAGFTNIIKNVSAIANHLGSTTNARSGLGGTGPSSNGASNNKTNNLNPNQPNSNGLNRNSLVPSQPKGDSTKET
jgi:hypothetical protein